MPLFDRISLKSLIRSHFDSLYDYAYLKINGRKRMPREDKVVFFVIPGLISVALISFQIYLPENQLETVLTTMSIFTGLLFGLLPLVINLISEARKSVEMLRKTNPDELVEKELRRSEIKFSISKELFTNIGFTILIAILVIVFSVSTQLYFPLPKRWGLSHVLSIVNPMFIIFSHFISYFLMIHFVFTLMMVLKRFNLLYSQEVE